MSCADVCLGSEDETLSLSESPELKQTRLKELRYSCGSKHRRWPLSAPPIPRPEMKPPTSAPVSAFHQASGGNWGETSNVLLRSDLQLSHDPHSLMSPGCVRSDYFSDLSWSESFCVLVEAADLDVEEEVLKQVVAETMA